VMPLAITTSSYVPWSMVEGTVKVVDTSMAPVPMPMVEWFAVRQ